MFTIRNFYTKETLHQARTLQDARNWCNQNLCRVTGNRQQVLSDLACRLINVYDASNDWNYLNPGF
jgi:hypothetical protein